MYKIICITNAQLCVNEDFLSRLKKIISAKPDYIILREKNLSEQSYYDLAKVVIKMCGDKVQCILHTYISVAIGLRHKLLHLPIQNALSLSDDDYCRQNFDLLGVSCHSVEEALVACRLGCSYITAGHIFDTQCKVGLQPKGLDLIRQISHTVDLPVYGLGGINVSNAKSVINSGAMGICLMSQFMQCDNPEKLIEELRDSLERS